ncbi:MAG: M23 family metallopeptidase [Clostridia bacterium]|nr:M23 family metallopeptidase [Clostridia bacterium]
MIKKLKNLKFTKKGVYISLAVCMLLLGGIGIFSSVRNMSKIIEEADIDYSVLQTGTELSDLPATPVNEEKKPIEEKKVVLNFTAPAEGKVVKEFSGLELVWSNTMEDYRTHVGIDVMTEDGTSVTAIESGKIINVYDDALWGTTIEIEHEGGFTSCYRNLSKLLPEGIEVGSFIEKGGIIGTVGSTALVEIGDNTHLHFEMCLNSTPVNPLDYVTFN